MAKEYIERETALKNIKETIIGASEFANDIRIAAINAVNSAPTADVQEVRHGKWYHIGGDEWCCSCCGHIVSTEGSWEKPTKKYCSECGAKMDKE